MRKRVLSLLLVLAMLMSMIVVAVEAEGAAPSTVAEKIAFGEEVAAYAATMQFPTEGDSLAEEGYEAWCPVCQKTAVWLARGEGSGHKNNLIEAADGKHYYLVGDLEQIQHQGSGTACVYLNGKNVNAVSGTYAITMGNKDATIVLNVMGTGDMTGSFADCGNKGTGVTANIYGKETKLNLYGGTLKKKQDISYPVIAWLASGRTVNVYAGATLDGTGTTASTNGGGVHITNGTVNMYGGKIINGKGNAQGGNVFLNGTGAFNMYGGEISGGTVSSGAKDVYVKGGTFYVEGKSVIGQMKVADAATFTAGTLTEGADIGYAKETAGRIFAEKKDLTKYIHAYEAGGSVLLADSKYMTYSTPTCPEGYCPVCDTEATWVEATNGATVANLGTHIKLGSTAVYTLYKYDAGKTCLYMNGKNIIRDGAAGNQGNCIGYSGAEGSVFNIIGKGIIRGRDDRGGLATINWYGSGNTALNLYGVTLSKANDAPVNLLTLDDKETLSIYDGASIDLSNLQSGRALNITSANAIVNLNGGTIKSAAKGTDGEAGGVVQMSNGTFNMKYGEIIGSASASNTNGGIFAISGSTTKLTINGGTVSGGKTNTNGGNIYMSNGTVTVNGGKIINGLAGNSGGNLYKEGGTFIMNGGEISGGVATSGYAGNIRFNGSSNNTLAGGVISGGSCADNKFDNIYVDTCSVNVTGATILANTIRVNGSGSYIKVTGGRVDATISAPDGVIGYRVQVGDGYTVVETANASTGRIANASVEGFGPGFINTADGKLSIDVALTNALGVKDLELKILDAQGNVIATTSPTADCLKTLTGAQTASLTVSTMLSGTSANWKTEGSLNKTPLPASMALYVNGLDFALKTCTINGADKETALNATEWEAYFTVSDAAGNNYATLEDALAKADAGAELIISGVASNDFVQIQKPITLNVAQGVTLNVDLNGKKITVKGEGTVNCIDSTGDEWNTPTGSVKKEGNAKVSTDVKTADKRYLGVQNNAGDYIFFRVEIKLTAMTLNAQTGNIYYKSSIQCAQALGQYVDEFGVIYDLNGTPDGTEDGKQWAKMQAELNAGINEGFVNKAYSTYVYGIVEEGSANNLTYGAKKIFANPYLMIDGQLILGYEENDGVSLEQLVRYYYTGAQGNRPIDKIAAENAAKAELLNSFCVKYGLTSWQTNN